MAGQAMKCSIIFVFGILGFLGFTTGCGVKSVPLAVLPITDLNASKYNLEGIKSYNDGKWENAVVHFKSALAVNQKLAESHFNLALTLHKLGRHEEAKLHFEEAGKLEPSNKEIVKSLIYRNHLGLSSVLEKHISGGYRY